MPGLAGHAVAPRHLLKTLKAPEGALQIVDLGACLGSDLARLPYVLRILLENVIRNEPEAAHEVHIQAFRDWLKSGSSVHEIPFLPGRIMMHDTTCGPALVDIAGMRDVLAEHGLDPTLLQTRISVDVSTDHSSGVDYFGREDAFALNLEREFVRNAERYRLMKWASRAMPGIRVHPPGSGIMHTINLERLSRVVVSENGMAFPDTLIGTDSHTPMINGLGVLGWGVGGLEAEGALFGVPVIIRIPDVIGVRLEGRLRGGIMATDLALHITETLRSLDVTGAFVEFFGAGVSTLSVGERACIANMAPEYGASTGYFPVDAASCAYLAGLGRPDNQIALVRDYAVATGLWFDPAGTPRFSRVLTIDLMSIAPSVAGPRRPQDRMRAGNTRSAFTPPLTGAPKQALPDGAVAIAAITSCTNTSDPRMLVAAGLLARKARQAGLRPPRWVKTSLAPGSPTARRFLNRNGLMADLEAMGFGIVGFGCTTCIGNSGALTGEIQRELPNPGFRPVAVLSGNRNFPGRVHPDLEYGFLASPPMVVAFALVGHVNLDIELDSLGNDREGHPVRLADLWPSGEEIDAALAVGMDKGDFDIAYTEAAANPLWHQLESPGGARFIWDDASTYLRRPPFVMRNWRPKCTQQARLLLVLGDDITTDHISPANQISATSEAGQYLVAKGDDPADLNVFASRRGNFEVMLRGAFTNRLATNQLVPNEPAGRTIHAPSGEIVSLVEAARRYGEEGVPLIILAGERYGMGSSRDWAAKAVALLGVRVVIASSFERIHRTNLIGMGILPLILPDGLHPADLAVGVDDQFSLDFSFGNVTPRADVAVRIQDAGAKIRTLDLRAAVETSLEVELLRAGGILPHILARYLGDQTTHYEGAA